MNWRLILALVMYLVIFVSGLIITIALGITRGKFDGNCVLFVDMAWDGLRSKVTSWGASSTCNYVIYLPMIVCIFFPFFILLVAGYSFRSKGNSETEKLILSLPVMMLNVVCFVLVFVAACILSVGRLRMCSSLNYENRSPSCYDNDKSIKWDDYGTVTFVANIVLAEVTMWFCLLWWLILIVPEVVKRFRRPPSQTTVSTVAHN